MPEFIRGGRQLTDQQAKSSLEIAVQSVHVEVAWYFQSHNFTIHGFRLHYLPIVLSIADT